MGAARRNLQAQPKILKKSSKHQTYHSERKFSQKNSSHYLTTNPHENEQQKNYV
jgi:hypothetical protein